MLPFKIQQKWDKNLKHISEKKKSKQSDYFERSISRDVTSVKSAKEKEAIEATCGLCLEFEEKRVLWDSYCPFLLIFY